MVWCGVMNVMLQALASEVLRIKESGYPVVSDGDKMHVGGSSPPPPSQKSPGMFCIHPYSVTIMVQRSHILFRVIPGTKVRSSGGKKLQAIPQMGGGGGLGCASMKSRDVCQKYSGLRYNLTHKISVKCVSGYLTNPTLSLYTDH